MSPTRASIKLGLWPIAGITTVGVTAQDARDTIAAAIEHGITAFDTAFSYGYGGESDRFLGEFLPIDRSRFHVTGKVGQRWNERQQRVVDGRPETLIADAETSLRRLDTDYFDLLMLHSPDPNVPIEQSAEAMTRLHHQGLCRQVGICNVDDRSLQRFASSAPCHAIQCPLNLLQRDSLESLIPTARRVGCDVDVYWTLMKGLLAGKIPRDHRFAAGDSRPGYAIYQGDQRRRAHDVLDALQAIAQRESISVAQLAIGWAVAQDGVASAMVGARRVEQVQEIAATRRLTAEVVKSIDTIVADCG